MIDSTKITILLCLTILVTSILVMSYNEYVNRFSIIATQDNGIYIFDKKSATLNKCQNGQCTTILTNFPQNPLLQSGNKQQFATNITQQQANSNDNNVSKNQQSANIIPQNVNNQLPVNTVIPNINSQSNTNTPLPISNIVSNNNQQNIPNNNIPQITIVNPNNKSK